MEAQGQQDRGAWGCFGGEKEQEEEEEEEEEEDPTYLALQPTAALARAFEIAGDPLSAEASSCPNPTQVTACQPQVLAA